MDNNKKKAIIFMLISLSANLCFAESDVMVKVNDDTVYISGRVANDNQAILLNEMANTLPSFSDVDLENVSIGSDHHPIPDDMLTAKVNGGFMRAALFGPDSNFDDMTIKVETDDGVVKLTGTASSQQQLDNALSIARLVAGVKEVESDVTVQ